jgi:hypothetical protein
VDLERETAPLVTEKQPPFCVEVGWAIVAPVSERVPSVAEKSAREGELDVKLDALKVELPVEECDQNVGAEFEEKEHELVLAEALWETEKSTREAALVDRVLLEKVQPSNEAAVLPEASSSWALLDVKVVLETASVPEEVEVEMSEPGGTVLPEKDEPASWKAPWKP